MCLIGHHSELIFDQLSNSNEFSPSIPDHGQELIITVLEVLHAEQILFHQMIIHLRNTVELFLYFILCEVF